MIMFLAWREMKHAKLRYLLIGFIMVLIAFMVLFVSGLAQGLASDNAASIQKMNTDYLVLQKDSSDRLNRSALTEEQVNLIKKEAGSDKADALGVLMTSISKGSSAKKTDAVFFAVSPEGDLVPKAAEGKSLTETSGREVVADLSLQNEGIKLGDKIKDQVSGTTFTVAGFTKDESFSHAPVIHMNMETWTSIQKSGEAVYSAVALSADEDRAKAIAKPVKETEVVSKEAALKGIPGYKEEQGSLTMMIVFLFIIAAFVLAVFFYVMTIQKMNQFGVLKAIGAKTGYLAKNILAQIILLTIISLAVSIALTFGIAALLPSGMPFMISTKLIVGSSILFLLVSIAGSLLSLYKVAKIDALDAIGRAA